MSRLKSFIQSVLPIIGKDFDRADLAAKFANTLTLALGDGPVVSEPSVQIGEHKTFFIANVKNPGDDLESKFVLSIQDSTPTLTVSLWDRHPVAGDDIRLHEVSTTADDTMTFLDNPRSLINKVALDYVDKIHKGKIDCIKKAMQNFTADIDHYCNTL
jgi:hypothetical protein